MPDAHELYELTGDLPELDRPVLVQAMTGFVDAGGATRLARDQLLAADDTELLVALRHRRAARLPLAPPDDAVRRGPLGELRGAAARASSALPTSQGTQFLLLTGPEPDLAWERFTAAVIDLVDRMNVRLTVGFNAIPMAVPHTRPTGVTAHASKRELIAGYEPWLQRVQVPGSAGHLLEYRLGQQGHDAMGFAVHVPHYLAQTDFPAGRRAALTSLSRTTGLLLPTDALRRPGPRSGPRSTARSARTRKRPRSSSRWRRSTTPICAAGPTGGNLLATSGPLPTAEELGAELERFLANQTNPPGDQPNQ